MPDLLPISTEEMIAEVEREIALRRRVYPRWVADRRMTQAKADRQIEVMESIAAKLLEDRRAPTPAAGDQNTGTQ